MSFIKRLVQKPNDAWDELDQAQAWLVVAQCILFAAILFKIYMIVFR
jgi:hypothetical protein